MGKCIVCNKSAGPFYSLHKTCYQVYEDTRESLHKAFSKCVESSEHSSKFVATVNECKPASAFSQNLFTSLVKREWQDQAKKIIQSKSLNASHARNLLSTATVLEIQDKDVEPHLFTRLANVEYLERLDQNQTISANFPELYKEIDMANDESLMWVFEETLKVEAKRQRDQQWTIFHSILNNLFNRSRYKQLDVEVEAMGQLVVTDRSLYYVTKRNTTKINFADIYSTTPLKDGVRIQTTQRDATPDTYITGDGRFTYSLLSYAVDQKSTELAENSF